MRRILVPTDFSAPSDAALDCARRLAAGVGASVHLLHVLAGRTVTDLDASVLEALATLDGAIVTEPGGQLLAVGAILRHPQGAVPSAEGATEGARSTAAMAASRYGPVLKVSEDGMITFFDSGRIWDI